MNPSNKTHELRQRNPQTQTQIEPTNVCDSSDKGRFPFVSLFFICVEQELESLILEFHWQIVS